MYDEEMVKEAFERVKQDIFSLGDEVNQLKTDVLDIKNLLKYLDNSINDLKLQKIQETSTHRQINQTDSATSTHNTTDAVEIGGLNYPNLDSSIGNRGASTDRQTDRQTDNQAHFTHKIPKSADQPIDQSLSEASEILDNLDSLKKQIRLKFKQMTDQEMLVFSTIYQLEEQNLDPDYGKIALKLGLSQSSIRDYVQRMINKGIPIQKTKLNNKKITLKISPELKKIATLPTILKLREI